jgi:modulator of FtsH protease HflC
MQRVVPFLVGLLILLGIGSTMVFTVDQRQYALVFALGEVRQVVTRPGLHFKLPPPFQNVVYFDNRILTIDTPDVDRFITAEKLNIMLDSFVKWRIADPRQFYVSVAGSEIIAGDRISRSLRDALNNEIARNTVADVISGERQQMLDRVRNRVSEDMKTIGADVIDVRLKRVDFAPEVSERVFDRMQSERKRVANERRATGAAESERIRADADRQREVIVAEAYRDAQRVRGEGDALATSLYAEAFGKDPEFAEFYRSLDAYRNSFRSRNDLLVLDPSADFFKYFRSSTAGVRDPLAPRDPPATAARDGGPVAAPAVSGAPATTAVAREPAVTPTRIR